MPLPLCRMLGCLSVQTLHGYVSYRKSYVEAEEEDDGPFIPRPSSSSPSYYRYGLVPSRPSSVHDEHP